MDKKKKKKMKIRMACEWKNLGRFAIDHFAISDGWLRDENPDMVNPQERVELIHRHYLTTYFKAATYSKDFSKNGYDSNLNVSGQVLPFAEIAKIMEHVLKDWNKRLIYPYSEKLKWKQLSKDRLNLLDRNNPPSRGNNPPLWRENPESSLGLVWSGAPKIDGVQQRFKSVWQELENESYYVPCKYIRFRNPEDVVVDWDESPCEHYAIGARDLCDLGNPETSVQLSTISKKLSIISKRGTTEEIARELFMDFLFLIVVTLNDEDLNRVYKMTFRLDEEIGKESDFGAEISVKGYVDRVVRKWDKQRILLYAAKLGWNYSKGLLDEDLLNDDVLIREMSKRNLGDAQRFRKRIRKAVLFRVLCQRFIDADNASCNGVVTDNASREDVDTDDENRKSFLKALKDFVNGQTERGEVN